MILTIIAGVLFKFCSYYLTNSKDTYSGTHNRIDALAWGVLLNLIITYHGECLKSLSYKLISFFLGLIIFIGVIYFHVYYNSVLFEKIYLHSIVPFSFFLMMSGLYFVDFCRFKLIRFISYYSYNWYLWHPVFVIFITAHIANTMLGLTTYLVVTFVMAMIFTIIIEETFLQKRTAIINMLFRNSNL